MGFRFRKSLNLGGGFKINFSKSGIGYSAGGKGFRVTKTAKGTTRTTASIPGTGLSYVNETGKGKRQRNYNSVKESYLPQVQDYSDLPAPKSSKYYNFRYYSLKICPIPLMLFFIGYIINALCGNGFHENGIPLTGLKAVFATTVAIVGLFITFHIFRFIFFHLPMGYISSYKYYDKLLKYCTLAATAAKREREEFEEEYASIVETNVEETKQLDIQEASSEGFVVDTSKSEYDNWLNFLDFGGTSEEWQSLKHANNWKFEISETESYTNYLAVVRPVSSKYYSSMEKIQKDWSVLYNLKNYTGQLSDKFEEDCIKNISDFIELKSVLDRYKEKVPTNIPAFRRLAMLYEKQGRFEEAIDVCRQACSFGMDERSRMVRMIKKAKRNPTAEEELIINQTF